MRDFTVPARRQLYSDLRLLSNSFFAFAIETCLSPTPHLHPAVLQHDIHRTQSRLRSCRAPTPREIASRGIPSRPPPKPLLGHPTTMNPV